MSTVVHVDAPDGYGARVYHNGYCLTLHGRALSQADVMSLRGLAFTEALVESVRFAALEQGWNYTAKLSLIPTMS